MPRKICAQAGCRQPQTKNNRCDKHQPKSKTSTNRYKEISVDTNGKYVYNTTQWKKLRRHKIANDPLCEHCYKQGLIVEAREVDHITEVQDDPTKAYDYTNLQSLCRSCHKIKTDQERTKRKP